MIALAVAGCVSPTATPTVWLLPFWIRFPLARGGGYLELATLLLVTSLTGGVSLAVSFRQSVNRVLAQGDTRFGVTGPGESESRP